jgi:MFS superfamily sulfate permease-like transporter
LAVLFLGVLPGLVLSVVVSIVLILVFVSHADFSLLGKAPDGDAFGDLAHHPDYERGPGLMIFRLNAPVMVVNVRRLRELRLQTVKQSEPSPRVVLLDLSMNSEFDIESADVLAETRTELAAQGIELWLVSVHYKVGEMLKRAGYLDTGETRQFFPSIQLALAHFRQRDVHEHTDMPESAYMPESE